VVSPPVLPSPLVSTLARRAAAAGVGAWPVTLLGLLLAPLAFLGFWTAHYWWGALAAVLFALTDGIALALTYSATAASRWVRRFRLAVASTLPPFWWWAWLHGLGGVGRQLEEVYKGGLLVVIVGGHSAGRIIDGYFRWRFKMPLHQWQPFDRRFQRFAARRDINLLILLVSLLAGRPDVGIQLLALWSLLTLFVHAVRLAMAENAAARGTPIGPEPAER